MTSYVQGHRPANRGMERERFVEARVYGIDRLRRRGKQMTPVHLFLAPTTHGRVRIWAHPEDGPLFALMLRSADYIGRVIPKQSTKQIAVIVRNAIDGREVAPCG